MPKDLELRCALCDEKKRFVDAKDVTFRQWNIIGWNVNSGNPIVSCTECGVPWRKEKDGTGYDKTVVSPEKGKKKRRRRSVDSRVDESGEVDGETVGNTKRSSGDSKGTRRKSTKTDETVAQKDSRKSSNKGGKGKSKRSVGAGGKKRKVHRTTSTKRKTKV